MDKNKMKSRIRQIKIILLVALIVLLLGTPIFAFFRIHSQSNTALREAKNVKLALQMLDIEYYGQGSCVYDASNDNGLRDGVQEEIFKLLEHDGEVILQSYNKKTRTINAFMYTNAHYEVMYYNDKDKGDTWRVRYFITMRD